MKKALFFTLVFSLFALVILMACERTVDDYTPNQHGFIFRNLDSASVLYTIITEDNDTIYKIPTSADSVVYTLNHWDVGTTLRIVTRPYVDARHSIEVFHNKNVVDSIKSDSTIIVIPRVGPDTIQTIDTVYTFPAL